MGWTSGQAAGFKQKEEKGVIRSIRPYQIFTLLEESAPDRIANVKIPHRQDLKLIETFLLIAAMRLREG